MIFEILEILLNNSKFRHIYKHKKINILQVKNNKVKFNTWF